MKLLRCFPQWLLWAEISPGSSVNAMEMVVKVLPKDTRAAWTPRNATENWAGISSWFLFFLCTFYLFVFKVSNLCWEWHYKRRKCVLVLQLWLLCTVNVKKKRFVKFCPHDKCLKSRTFELFLEWFWFTILFRAKKQMDLYFCCFWDVEPMLPWRRRESHNKTFISKQKKTMDNCHRSTNVYTKKVKKKNSQGSSKSHLLFNCSLYEKLKVHMTD